MFIIRCLASGQKHTYSPNMPSALCSRRKIQYMPSPQAPAPPSQYTYFYIRSWGSVDHMPIRCSTYSKLHLPLSRCPGLNSYLNTDLHLNKWLSVAFTALIRVSLINVYWFILRPITATPGRTSSSFTSTGPKLSLLLFSNNFPRWTSPPPRGENSQEEQSSIEESVFNRQKPLVTW